MFTGVFGDQTVLDVADGHRQVRTDGKFALASIAVHTTVDIYADNKSIGGIDGFNGSAIVFPQSAFEAGTHEITLVIDYTRDADVEYCYLVGDFGVEVLGTHIRIVPAPEKLWFTDITRQGLAFYGGNVSYTFDAPGAGVLEVPHWRGAALAVAADGVDLGVIAYAPYRIRIPEGAKRITVTCMGNRFNTFGQLHYWEIDKLWYGPDSWRTKGKNWSYEYQLRPTGLLSAPVFYKD